MTVLSLVDFFIQIVKQRGLLSTGGKSLARPPYSLHGAGAFEAQQSTAKWRRFALFKGAQLFRKSEALSLECAAEAAPIAPSRAGNHHLGARVGMALNQLRHQLCVVALVKHIAADDQVKVAQLRRGLFPRQIEVVERFQLVKGRVVIEKMLDHGVMIAGGNISAALLQHQAGQPEATADFQNPPALDFDDLNGFGQCATSRPELAE